MLKTTTALLLIFCMGFLSTAYSQNSVPEMDDNALIIKFMPGISAQAISDAMQELNSVVIWSDPASSLFFTEVISFPYNDPEGNVISDINNQIVTAQNRGDVDDVNHDYLIKNPALVGGIPPGILCQKNIPSPNAVNTYIKVTIMDTGLSDLFTGFSPQSTWNYVTGQSNASDDNGHGTHIASIISESFEINTGYNASQLKWDIRKTHDANGEAYLSDIIHALIDAIAINTNIINMSFSYENLLNDNYSIFQEMITRAEAEKILIVTSAGNEGENIDTANGQNIFPCSFSNYNLLTVGSYDCENNQMSSFSNFGTYSVDIAAPGEGVEGVNWETGNPYYLSGTSQATALTSGVAAALAAHVNYFNYIEIKCAILTGAQPKASLDTKVLCKGLLNPKRARVKLMAGCTEIVEPESDPIDPRARLGLAKGVELFPNPATSEIYLSIDKIEASMNYSIFDVNGRLMATEDIFETGKKQINVNDLAPAIYYLRLTDGGQQSNFTFVKQ